MRASEAPELFGIDATEMQRRSRQLQTLSKKREEQIEAFRVLFSHERQALNQKQGARDEANARFLDDYGDSTTASTLVSFLRSVWLPKARRGVLFFVYTCSPNVMTLYAHMVLAG